MGIHSEAELNRKFSEFAKLFNIYLNHFPKHEKYALANRIRNTAYEVYDLISEGQKMWRSVTFIRKYSLYKFRRAVKAGKQESINSLLGHAQSTNSLSYMLKMIKEEIANGKYLQIPKGYRCTYDALPEGEAGAMSCPSTAAICFLIALSGLWRILL